MAGTHVRHVRSKKGVRAYVVHNPTREGAARRNKRRATDPAGRGRTTEVIGDIEFALRGELHNLTRTLNATRAAGASTPRAR